MTRLLVVALIALASLGSFDQAGAAGSGSIAFSVTLGAYEPALPQLVPVKKCSLWVEDGSDGLAILNAARDEGCIKSFSVYAPSYRNPYGPYVHCIESRCENREGTRVAGTWIAAVDWAVWINGRFEHNYGNLGLHHVFVESGDRIAFSFNRYFNGLICPCI